jgi:hypothetical protein
MAVVWTVKVKIWKIPQKAEKAPRRYQNSAPQRVLNDLWKTRLSRRRLIWFLPTPVSELDRRYKGRLRKRDNLLTGEERQGRGRSQIGEKTWTSINHSILSAAPLPPLTQMTHSSLTCS